MTDLHPFVLSVAFRWVNTPVSLPLHFACVDKVKRAGGKLSVKRSPYCLKRPSDNSEYFPSVGNTGVCFYGFLRRAPQA